MNPALPKRTMIMFKSIINVIKNMGCGKNSKSKIQEGRAG